MNAATWKRVALLTGLVVAVYANALDGTFHYDDFHSLVDNPHPRDLGQVPRFFVDPYLFSADVDKAMYRPLVLTSYAVNYALGGKEAGGFLTVNLLLHLACALLVWRIARRLGWGGEAGAVSAAMLFAVHPVMSETVNYVSSRSESLAALFLLAALLTYLRAHTDGPAWRWLSVAVFAGSLLSKATGMALLLILMAYEILVRSSDSWSVRSRRLVPFAVIATAYVSLLAASGLLPVGEGTPVRGVAAQAATQLKAVGYYMHLLAVPVAQSVDPPFQEGRIGQAAVWCGAALLASWVGLAVRATRGRNRWWLLLPLLAALPASAVPLNVLVNEHRVYACIAGFAVLLTGVRPAVGRWRLPGLALVTIWGVLTFQRNDAWASERTLWSEAVAVGPHQARARVHLGNALRDAGELDAAREQFEAAVAAEPDNRAARTNVANTIYEVARAAGDDRGMLSEAASHYRQVLVLDAEDREALTNLGNVQLALGDTAAAAAAYRRAVDAHPNYADARANLAMLEMGRGDHAAAAVLLERVVELEPSIAAGHSRLGDARALQGDLRAAREAYERACGLDPMDAAACYNLGEVSLALAGQAEAAGDAGTAAALWRRASEAYAHVLHRFGDYRRTRQRLEALGQRP